MAANGSRGGLRPNHGSRAPPFVVVGLLVVVAILGFNYWNSASKNSVLTTSVRALEKQLETAAQKEVHINTRADQLIKSVKDKDDELASVRAEVAKKEMLAKQIDIDCKTQTENLNDQIQEHRSTNEDASAQLRKCEQEMTQCSEKQKSLLEEYEAKMLSLKEDTGSNMQQLCDQRLDQMRLAVLQIIGKELGQSTLELLGSKGVNLNGVQMDLFPIKGNMLNDMLAEMKPADSPAKPDNSFNSLNPAAPQEEVKLNPEHSRFDLPSDPPQTVNNSLQEGLRQPINQPEPVLNVQQDTQNFQRQSGSINQQPMNVQPESSRFNQPSALDSFKQPIQPESNNIDPNLQQASLPIQRESLNPNQPAGSNFYAREGDSHAAASVNQPESDGLNKQPETMDVRQPETVNLNAPGLEQSSNVEAPETVDAVSDTQSMPDQIRMIDTQQGDDQRDDEVIHPGMERPDDEDEDEEEETQQVLRPFAPSFVVAAPDIKPQSDDGDTFNMRQDEHGMSRVDYGDDESEETEDYNTVDNMQDAEAAVVQQHRLQEGPSEAVIAAPRLNPLPDSQWNANELAQPQPFADVAQPFVAADQPFAALDVLKAELPQNPRFRGLMNQIRVNEQLRQQPQQVQQPSGGFMRRRLLAAFPMGDEGFAEEEEEEEEGGGEIQENLLAEIEDSPEDEMIEEAADENLEQEEDQPKESGRRYGLHDVGPNFGGMEVELPNYEPRPDHPVFSEEDAVTTGATYEEATNKEVAIPTVGTEDEDDDDEVVDPFDDSKSESAMFEDDMEVVHQPNDEATAMATTEDLEIDNWGLVETTTRRESATEEPIVDSRESEEYQGEEDVPAPPFSNNADPVLIPQHLQAQPPINPQAEETPYISKQAQNIEGELVEEATAHPVASSAFGQQSRFAEQSSLVAAPEVPLNPVLPKYNPAEALAVDRPVLGAASVDVPSSSLLNRPVDSPPLNANQLSVEAQPLAYQPLAARPGLALSAFKFGPQPEVESNVLNQAPPPFNQAADAFNPSAAVQNQAPFESAPALNQAAAAFEPAQVNQAAAAFEPAPALNQAAAAFEPAQVNQAAAAFEPAQVNQAAAAFEPAPALNQAAAVFDPAPALNQAAAAFEPAQVNQAAAAFEPAPALNQAAAVFDPAPALNQAAAAFKPAPALNQAAAAFEPAQANQAAAAFDPAPLRQAAAALEEGHAALNQAQQVVSAFEPAALNQEAAAPIRNVFNQAAARGPALYPVASAFEEESDVIEEPQGLDEVDEVLQEGEALSHRVGVVPNELINGNTLLLAPDSGNADEIRPIMKASAQALQQQQLSNDLGTDEEDDALPEAIVGMSDSDGQELKFHQAGAVHEDMENIDRMNQQMLDADDIGQKPVGIVF
ncbi:hypothetical protein CAPTEDRAFT_220097 [Capitella teleta]|uniref:Uncharacterized protein n=1 Tax=Capitella teleta TaxID=283909 RepID=R7UQ85_CAPTE|nr:hypothetical protein CAPTEDRAFT_220097 [Capitella teleta]|eukprot:ELU08278.1 hypothetical protein CAPTEDRAFT_220097 [Capitella teleta]